MVGQCQSFINMTLALQIPKGRESFCSFGTYSLFWWESEEKRMRFWFNYPGEWVSYMECERSGEVMNSLVWQYWLLNQILSWKKWKADCGTNYQWQGAPIIWTITVTPHHFIENLEQKKMERTRRWLYMAPWLVLSAMCVYMLLYVCYYGRNGPSQSYLYTGLSSFKRGIDHYAGILSFSVFQVHCMYFPFWGEKSLFDG